MAYDKQIKITVDNSGLTETLTDFPHLINLSADCGVNSADVSIIFTILGDDHKLKIKLLDDSENEHYVEIKQWSASASKAVLFAKITRTAGVDNVLYLKYPSTPSSESDNSTYIGVVGSTAGQNVYNSNYKAVYTMAQNPAAGGACILDSTVNANHGTTYGSMTSGQLVDGLVAKGLDLDGSNDYIGLSTKPASNLSAITIEALLKIDSYPTNDSDEVTIYRENSMGFEGNGVVVGIANSTHKLKCRYYQSSLVNPPTTLSTSTIDTGIFYHVVYTRIANGLGKIYINGALQGQTTQNNTTLVSESNGFLGQWDDMVTTASYGNFTYEALRIASTAFSADWAAAAALSLKDETNTITIPSYYIGGNVKAGTTFMETTVRVEKLDGTELGSTISSDVDGSFIVSGLEGVDSSDEVQVIIHTSDSIKYNDLIFRVNPVL